MRVDPSPVVHHVLPSSENHALDAHEPRIGDGNPYPTLTCMPCASEMVRSSDVRRVFKVIACTIGAGAVAAECDMVVAIGVSALSSHGASGVAAAAE